MDIFSVIRLCGGLALFLYGMHNMGQGLSKVSGGKLERILEKVAGNPIKGAILGMLVTIVIQSSSATTVMVVGFVNSGIMELSQAIGIIMGANIGTTITAWILSLTNISSSNIFVEMLKPDSFSPILALIGVFMILVSKKSRRRDLGEIFVSFAVLIFGMTTMSGAVAGLKDWPGFSEVIMLFANNPILGLLTGAVVTGIIQSSAASIGILQALAVTGGITYGAAIPIILGQNIGTCATALISCIGANKNAKRAAVVHLYFNIIGSLLFMAAFYGLDLIFHFPFIDETINAVGIPAVHSIFNVSTVLVLLPFSKQLGKLAVLTVRDRKTDEDMPLLDERLLSSPSFALEQCKNVVFDMARCTEKTLLAAIDQISNRNEKLFDKISENEEKIDRYEDILGTYLVKLSACEVTEKDSREISQFLQVIGDFERIGDHAENILDAVRELTEKKIKFSEKAEKEVDTISAAVREIVANTFKAFTDNDIALAKKTEPLEQTVDELQHELKDRHIRRLKEGRCTIELGFIFTELLTAFERISDHCSNIAVGVIQHDGSSLNSHMYLNDIKKREPEDFKEDFNHYVEKYKLP